MKADSFIARRLRFKGKMAVISMAISFLVIIFSLAVAGGYRYEIRTRLAEQCGDVVLSKAGSTMLGNEIPMRSDLSYLPKIEALESVESVQAVAYRAGIVRSQGQIQGVVFKGTASFQDSVTLGVGIPSKLASKLHLCAGDRLPAYFVGEKVKVRNFTVTDIYESLIEADGSMILYCSIDDIRRLNEWEDNEASALEIKLSDKLSRNDVHLAATEIGSIALMNASDEDGILVAGSVADKYPQIFDWLGLIDVNVLAILALMIIVAGFNMISGLLIMLFRNISTIGTLKALGMKNKGIAKVFLRVAARLVLSGMLVGNALALVLCLVQDKTHFLRLDPANYFISFVPVRLEWASVVLVDAISFAAVMLLLIIPSLFVSKVDPAQSAKAD